MQLAHGSVVSSLARLDSAVGLHALDPELDRDSGFYPEHCRFEPCRGRPFLDLFLFLRYYPAKEHSMARAEVLVLNADYRPYDLVDLAKAMDMICRDAVYILKAYGDRALRTVTDVFPWPAVVVLKRFQVTSRKVKFNRANLFARDVYQCQYCGVRPVRPKGDPDLSALTFDHVVPRSRAVNNKVRRADGTWVHVTGWDNIVACCHGCNGRKAAQTPTEAGMPLLRAPARPNAVDTVLLKLRKADIPREWEDHMPEGSPWRNYWEEELDVS